MPHAGNLILRQRGGKRIALALGLSLSCLVYSAHAQQLFSASVIDVELPDAPGEQILSQNSLGSISGIIVDSDGAFIANARITLTHEGPALRDQATTSDADGHFSFADISPGPYKLFVAAAGFSSQQTSGILHAAENYVVPSITLRSSTSVDVQVTASREEVAQAQIQDEEKQRVLGIIPNFYVSYESNPAPLTSKQKFELSWKTLIDPVTFAFTGVIAGVEQSQNDFKGYGSGPQGYAKRYAASYGTTLTATLLGNAILPSILKQDPRYFYKGTGSIRSRTLYTLAMAVVSKGDNGRWQFNYSGIFGTLAASGISNLYYPAADRNGAALTFENLGISIGGSVISNMFQEFLVPKLTPHKPAMPSSHP